MFEWLTGKRKPAHSSNPPPERISVTPPPEQPPQTEFVRQIMLATHQAERQEQQQLASAQAARQREITAEETRTQKRLNDTYNKCLHYMASPAILKELEDTIKASAVSQRSQNLDLTVWIEKRLRGMNFLQGSIDSADQAKAIEAALAAITPHFQKLGLTVSLYRYIYKESYFASESSYDITVEKSRDTSRPGIRVTW